MSDRVTPPFAGALADHVPVADGAMDAPLRSAEPALDDFAGHEGCDEIPNRIRTDVVRQVHRDYRVAGADAVETNTFGPNLADLAEYGIADRIFELALRGTEPTRATAGGFGGRSAPGPVGAVGPGIRAPTLGHVPFITLCDACIEQVKSGTRHAPGCGA